MKTHTTVLWRPKAGNQSSENQDAYFIASSHEGYCEDTNQRFAVADGATEAIYSGSWARLLVNAWGAATLEFSSDYERVISDLASRWKVGVPATDQPWWAEEKIKNGAFSTFAGLSLSNRQDGNGEWSLTAVGDSCFFLIRSNEVSFCGPLTKAEEFNSSPYLIGSSTQYNSALKVNIFTSAGELRAGDELILATDAFACWFLSKLEQGLPLSAILSFQDNEHDDAFDEFLRTARSNSDMRNDDVTLVSISVLELDDVPLAVEG